MSQQMEAIKTQEKDLETQKEQLQEHSPQQNQEQLLRLVLDLI